MGVTLRILRLPEGDPALPLPSYETPGRHGVTLANAPGTIDADYRGPLGVILINLGEAPYTVAHGARIAQMVLARVARAIFAEADALGATARGAGGFGSTGGV
ncbi:MAG: hypothetical protein CVT80_12535 [Alphaproteobacteria bacterium HGW-Alphaproteobacteria-2]|nr:MAG: hypothetical protein CVT80_12535 [Alphaproteobacteria bacterium HGW-Alphaproteobacteria-2]